MVLKDILMAPVSHGQWLEGTRYVVSHITAKAEWSANRVMLVFEVPGSDTKEPRYSFFYPSLSHVLNLLHEGVLKNHGPFDTGFLTMADERIDSLRSRGGKRQRKRKLTRYRDDRLDIIESIVAVDSDVFDALDPAAAIKRRVRGISNEGRILQLALRYLMHGRHPNSLLPAFQNIGRPERDETDKEETARILASKPRGRPVKDPTKTPRRGPTLPETKRLMREGYQAHKEIGKPLTHIWADTIVHEFGAIKRPDGIYETPEGRVAHPSYGTFWHFVRGERSAQQRVIDQFGEKRWEERFARSMGSVRETTSYIGGHVQWDAQVIDEEVVSMSDRKTPARQLVRVRIYDIFGKQLLGIGYDLGETAVAYGMAYFCMLIDKRSFCRYFGIELPKGIWEVQGRTPHLMGDRGVPMANVVQARFKSVPMIREFARTGRGKDKAGVEGSNSKPRLDDKGWAIKTKSGRTIRELVKLDIEDHIGWMCSSSTVSRLSPGEAFEIDEASPAALYRLYTSKGMNRMSRVDFDDAVRAALPRIDVRVCEDGVQMGSFVYRSQELIDSGLLQEAKAAPLPGVAYTVNIAVRFLLFEHPTLGIIELEVVPSAFGKMFEYERMTSFDAEKLAERERALSRDAARKRQNDAIDKSARREQSDSRSGTRAGGKAPSPDDRHAEEQVLRRKAA